MDITIKCQLSLSKKLRALISEGETRITMVASSITDGRGEARLIIASDRDLNKSLPDFFGKETSIMLTPVEMEDITMDNNTVGTIFTKHPHKTGTKRTTVDKMAAMEIEEDDDEGYAIKTEKEIEEEIPEVFEVTKNKAFKKYINSLEALDQAIIDAKDKTSDIDPESIQNPRKRAEAIELKEKSEAIDVDAFIVNDKCANLAINDLGINLALNAPYNLANISAKRLLGSKDLKAMFNAQLVKFIRPEEISIYTKKAERAFEKPTCDVFSSPEEAERQMEQSGMNVEKIEMSASELSDPTENEMLLTNLTSRPSAITAGGVTRSIHGNASGRTSRVATEDQKENSKGIKSIRRTGVQYNR